ncbi:tRNA-intron lyase [archaeon]|jgi:tRNA-intron endonuclease, archaea type|nr:tRNA-intron lyase [archaeon]
MEKIQAHLLGSTISSNSKQAYTQLNQTAIGEKAGDKVIYSLYEAMFLIQNNKMEIFSGKKIIDQEELLKKFTRIDKKFPIKYAVFKDLRVKGYVVKTALKFGAEFRVYHKGRKPGKEHAKWIVFTDNETNKTTWHEFASKNRVAHSTKKNLLLGIVDEESQVLYYEVGWIKP